MDWVAKQDLAKIIPFIRASLEHEALDVIIAVETHGVAIKQMVLTYVLTIEIIR